MKEGPGVFIPEGHQLNMNSKGENEILYVSILNKVLPAEIKVIGWSPVSTTFSSRFDCKQRTYHYYFPKANLNVEVFLDYYTSREFVATGNNLTALNHFYLANERRRSAFNWRT